METRIEQCGVCGALIDLITGDCPECGPPAAAPVGLPPGLPAPSQAPRPQPAPVLLELDDDVPGTAAARAVATDAPLPVEPLGDAPDAIEIDMPVFVPGSAPEAVPAPAPDAAAAAAPAVAALEVVPEPPADAALPEEAFLELADEPPHVAAMPAAAAPLVEVLPAEPLPAPARRVADLPLPVASRLQPDLAEARLRRIEVDTALEILQRGEVEESLATLRRILQEAPEDEYAQRAIQDVRRAWHARRGAVPAPQAAPVATSPAPPPAPPAPAPPPVEEPAPPSTPETDAPARPGTGPMPAVRPKTVAMPAVSRTQALRAVTAPPRGATVASPRVELPTPRPQSARTPLPVVLGGAVVVVVVILWLALGGSQSPSGAGGGRAPRTPPPTTAPGPLADLPQSVREEVDEILAAYIGALESGEPERLARARPDLPEEERTRRLRALAGATNVAVDLRVVTVSTVDDMLTLEIHRTNVVVGGPNDGRVTLRETLRLRRGPAGSYVPVAPP